MTDCRLKQFLSCRRPGLQTWSLLVMGLMLGTLLAACASAPSADLRVTAQADTPLLAASTLSGDVEALPPLQDLVPLAADNAPGLARVGTLRPINGTVASSIFDYDLSPDQLLWTALNNNWLFIWRLSDGELLHQMERGSLQTLAFSRDKSTIWGSNSDGTLFRIDIAGGATLSAAETGLTDVTDVQYMDKADAFLVTSMQGSRIYRPADDSSTVISETVGQPVSAVSRRGDLAAVASDATLTVYDATDDENIDLQLPATPRSLFWADNTLLALYDTESGQAIALVTRDDKSQQFTISNTRTLSTQSVQDIVDANPDVWVLRTRQGLALANTDAAQIVTLPVASQRSDARLLDDSSLLITSSIQTGVQLWRLTQVSERGLQSATLPTGNTPITGIDLSDDQIQLFVIQADGIVQVWGVAAP